MLSFLFLACSCTAPASRPGAGSVTFVDAVGNRMQVDVPPPADQPPTATDGKPARPAAAMPEVPAAPAMTEVPATPAPPARGELPQAPAAAGADTGRVEFGGEVYQDVDRLDPAQQQRAGERFYQLPDGQGGRQVVTASTLGMNDGPPLPPAPRPVFEDHVLPCAAGAASLEHLLETRASRADLLLKFPVYDPTLDTRRRYAGYRIAVPENTESLAVRAVVGKQGAPDVLLVLADADMRPWMVVNNNATENIPENLFRYAMVAMDVPLGASVPKGSWLVVIEGPWARRVLADECRPSARIGTAVSGQLTIRFVTGPGRQP